MVWIIFLFFHILGITIPIDFHIFQRGSCTTNQQGSEGVAVSDFLWIRPVFFSHRHVRGCAEEEHATDLQSMHRYFINDHRLVILWIIMDYWYWWLVYTANPAPPKAWFWNPPNDWNTWINHLSTGALAILPSRVVLLFIDAFSKEFSCNTWDSTNKHVTLHGSTIARMTQLFAGKRCRIPGIIECPWHLPNTNATRCCSLVMFLCKVQTHPLTIDVSLLVVRRELRSHGHPYSQKIFPI